MLTFRPLNANEIECRVQSIKNGACILLLYKDARVDMRLLDETVGPFNWQREHTFKEGKLYCKVSIYDSEKQQWISKEDVGVESNTEQEKGQASDSFKRACFNWGIGRELYTAPFLYITLNDGEFTTDSKGVQRVSPRVKFSVKTITTKDGEITQLEVIDQTGKVRFSTGKKTVAKEPKNTKESEKQIEQPQQEIVNPETIQKYYSKGGIYKEVIDTHTQTYGKFKTQTEEQKKELLNKLNCLDAQLGGEN